MDQPTPPPPKPSISSKPPAPPKPPTPPKPPVRPASGSLSASSAPASAVPTAEQPAAAPRANGDKLQRAKHLYNELFPIGSPRRRYGPAVIAGVAIVVLLLAQCAVASAGKKISAMSDARTEAKRLESTGVLVVKSNRPEGTITATRIAAAGEAAAAPAQGSLGQSLPYLSPGRYDITVRSAGWPEVHGQVDVPAGQTTETTLNFQGGSLRLESEPPGTTVKFAGAELGKTPLTIPLLPPGEVELMLEYPSWPALAFKTTIVEGKESSASARLPHGKVVLETDPAGATVLYNNLPIGKTPLTIDRVPVGPRKYTLRPKEFPTIEVTVTVADGQEVKYQGALGAFFPALDPAALLRDVWIPDDRSKITTGFNATTGIYKPRNDVVKNIHREGLYNRWLNKVYRYSGAIKSYDTRSGKVEFAEGRSELSRYRVIAHAASGATFQKDETVSLYGMLSFVEEPAWPGRVITLELTDAQFLP